MHDENPSGTSLSSKTAHRGLRPSVLIALPGISQDLGDGSLIAQRACGFFHIVSTHSPITLCAMQRLSNTREGVSRNYFCPSLCFPLWPQGRTGTFRRHGCVQRSLPNHNDIWSTSPCYPAEGQMGTACLPLTGAGPSKGMQTLSSTDVFKILLSLWTSMECVTLPTDCATFQPSSFCDITHFNYFLKCPSRIPRIPENTLSSSFA